MSMNERLSRRELIRTCGAGALAWAAGVDIAAAQAEVRRTPAQILGPFYPVIKAADQDADLTRIAGRSTRAAGQVIELAGRVINCRGRPVAGARIEIWQAKVHSGQPGDAARERRWIARDGGQEGTDGDRLEMESQRARHNRIRTRIHRSDTDRNVDMTRVTTMATPMPIGMQVAVSQSP